MIKLIFVKMLQQLTLIQSESNRYCIISVIVIKPNFYTVGISKKIEKEDYIRRKSKVCTLDNQIKQSE